MSGRRWVSIGCSTALLVAGLATPHTAASAPAAARPERASTPVAPRPDAATGSVDVATPIGDAVAPPRLEAALRVRARTVAAGQTLTVEIAGNDRDIAAAVAASGGTLGRGGGGLYLATVPAGSLSTLAATVGVSSVHTPVAAVERRSGAPVIEAGSVAAPNAAPLVQWHNAGLKGNGAKVGVIGLFDTTVLSSEVASGDLPLIPSRARTCISGGVVCPFGTPGQTWGNSLAEIVYDGAPEASFFLAELGYRSDYYNVIDWFAANGVTMVINPLTWTLDGPGDGTGASAAIVDYAVSKGIAWFNTAGDLGQNLIASSYQGGYWRGTWSDTNNNRFLNFKGTDESLSTYCGFLLGVRWSDWGSNKTDYDVYISDFNPRTKVNGTKKLLSGFDQSVPGGTPLEAMFGVRLCNTNAANGPVYDTNKDGFISLWIQRKQTSPAASSVGDVIEIAAAYGWMEYSTSAGSVSLPFADSANPGMATVGGNSPWFDDATPGNSRGPTNDGRQKPDFVSFNCNDTAVDGHPNDDCSTGYYGSDGAAAAAVGYAAVVQQALHITTPQGLIRYLRDNAMSLGDPGQYGAGAVDVPYYAPPSAYPTAAFRPFTTPQRILDTRPASPIGVTTPGPLKANQTFGLSYPSPGAVVVLNVAIVKATTAGFLSVYPHGYSWPGATSNLNVDAGQTRANLVIVPIGTNFTIDIFSSGGGHVIVDILGEMVPDRSDGYVLNGQGAGRFAATQPYRVLDSRTCASPPCGAYAAGTFVDIPLYGTANPATPTDAVPDGAPAVALSVTVDNPAASGYLSVVPGGQTTTPTSSLNYEAGKSLTTTVFASVSASGVARVYLERSAHLQVDVLGWFTAATGVAEPTGMFVPMSPVRALDTRSPSNKAVANVPVTIDASAKGVPTNASAVFLNNGGVQPAGPGSLRASADAPTVDDIFTNLTMPTALKNVAAATITKVTGGTYRLTSTVDTHLISDISGYFQGPAFPPLAAGQTVRLPASLEDFNSSLAGRALSIADDGSVVAWEASMTHLATIWSQDTDAVETVRDTSWAIPIVERGGDSLVLEVLNYTSFGSRDIVRMDLATRTEELISVDSSEAFVAGSFSYWPSVSSDGVLVAFVTNAALDPSDSGTTMDVYLRNRSAGTTARIGLGSPLGKVSISADGSKVAWIRSGAVMDTRELVVHTVGTGLTTVFPTTANSGEVHLVGDGTKALVSRYTVNGWSLLELSFINTTTGAATIVTTPEWLTPVGRVSMADDGATIAVVGAGLQGGWLIDGQGLPLERFDRTSSGGHPNAVVGLAAISANGEYVVFQSRANNIVDADGPTPPLYRYQRGTT